MKRLIVALFLFLVAGIMAFGTSIAHAEGEGAQTVGSAACSSITDSSKQNCIDCFDRGGAWTAFNCLGGDSPSDFVTSFIKLGTGLGGGIAMLLILISGFQRITSAGNPEKLHEAKELMTAAISGLLLIIFSVYILKFIGVDVFGTLPGFGGGKNL